MTSLMQSEHYAYNINWDGSASSQSDARVKDNIQTIPNVLDKIDSLRGVYFNFKVKENFRRIGCIAQDFQEHFPEIVTQRFDEAAGEDRLTMDYSRISCILLQGIKELKNIVRNQEQKIAALQQAIASQ